MQNKIVLQYFKLYKIYKVQKLYKLILILIINKKLIKLMLQDKNICNNSQENLNKNNIINFKISICLMRQYIYQIVNFMRKAYKY